MTDRAGSHSQPCSARTRRLGRLDVVVNNAGYGLFGMIEEVSEKQARAQIETNVFGALWVTQAALPLLRAQRSGHILQVSSIGGITAFPMLGLYHASKWALEGLSQALAGEMAGFGVHVTLIEPGGFDTDWSGSSAVRAETIPAYDEVKQKLAELRMIDTSSARRIEGHGGGDLQRVVDAEKPPLRLFLGEAPIGSSNRDYARRIETWEAWNEVSKKAQG